MFYRASKLPVVRQHLRESADHHRLATAKHALDAGRDLLPKVLLDRNRALRETSEHKAVYDCGTELTRGVFLHAESRWHAPFALEPILECNANQIPLQIVGPGVIDAAEGLLSCHRAHRGR